MPQPDVESKGNPGGWNKPPLPHRMELSPDLISACLALEKYLDNPSALTERELVRGTLDWEGAPSATPCLLLVRRASLCQPQGRVLESWASGAREVGRGPRMIARWQSWPWFSVLPGA